MYQIKVHNNHGINLHQLEDKIGALIILIERPRQNSMVKGVCHGTELILCTMNGVKKNRKY